MKFEIDLSKLQETVEKSFLKHAQECFKVDYQNRIDVTHLTARAYSDLDETRILNLITLNLEREIATKIVYKILTELGTDIKDIMSNKQYRDDLKFHLRKTVDSICDNASLRNEAKRAE